MVEPTRHPLENGQTLVIREAEPTDAQAVLDHVHAISAESDYLSFGPGEFEIPIDQEVEILQRFHETANQLYLIGLLDDQIVSTLSFSGGHRRRTQHTGEFGVSVRQDYWGLGIGSRMLDALLAWARGTKIVSKINLRVRTDHPRAIGLYQRKGFTLEGTIRKAICIDGTYYDHHLMGLELCSEGSESDV
jgi:RimJ/RimL family protein N-acetyltransferase